MNPFSAFELGDLIDLLELDLTEPADQDDIEFIREILTRRRGVRDVPPAGEPPSRLRTGLHLVPDPRP